MLPIIKEDPASFLTFANLKYGGLDFLAAPFEENFMFSAFSDSLLRLFQRVVPTIDVMDAGSGLFR